MIFNKKILNVIKMIFIASIFVGCSTERAEEGVAVSLFDTNKGKGIIENYFTNIRLGNFDEANSLCSDDLLNDTKDLTQGVSQITSFSDHEIVEGNKSGYFIFNVIRDSMAEPKSDLEVYTIKVENQDKDYKITDIKSKAQKSIYVKNKALRVIGEDGGKSNLIISLNNIPKDTYLSENKAMLYKAEVPRENFGKVAVGFEGKKVALSTYGDNNSYIGVVYIDETLMEEGGVSDPEEGNGKGQKSKEQSSEKPVANKLISLDLLRNGKVTGFMFSKEDENLAVSFKNNKGVDRVKIYNTEEGDVVDIKIDEVFSADKYNIFVEHFTEDEFKFRTSLAKGNTNKDETLVGNFSVNLKTLELKKI